MTILAVTLASVTILVLVVAILELTGETIVGKIAETIAEITPHPHTGISAAGKQTTEIGGRTLAT